MENHILMHNITFNPSFLLPLYVSWTDQPSSFNSDKLTYWIFYVVDGAPNILSHSFFTCMGGQTMFDSCIGFEYIYIYRFFRYQQANSKFKDFNPSNLMSLIKWIIPFNLQLVIIHMYVSALFNNSTDDRQKLRGEKAY